jgi:hypothetical protein
MSMNENIQGNEMPSARPFRNMLHPLHEAAMRLAGAKGGATLTRDLVSMLLGHGARAYRSAQPRTQIHLYTTAPSGRRPVRIRLG